MDAEVQVALAHDDDASAHRDQPAAGFDLGACARRVYLRSVPPPVHRRTALRLRCAAVVARAFAASADFDAFAEFGRGSVARTGRLASVLPPAPTLARCPDVARVSAADWGQRAASDQPAFAATIAPSPRRATPRGRTDGRDGPAGGLQRLQKKAPALTPPPTRLWAGARSRPGRAAGLSATRNTPCVYGCPRRIRR